jgi:hypothetical protein
MDAYILGTHEGELPTHLLAHGEEGHRVRTMGRIEGPTHNVFYALEVPDLAAFERIAGHIADAGTANPQTIQPTGHPEYRSSKHAPSHFPPWDRIAILLLHLELEKQIAATAAAVKRLGDEGVAVITDGSGLTLAEFGGNDAAEVDAAAAEFAASGEGAEIHVLSADGFVSG